MSRWAPSEVVAEALTGDEPAVERLIVAVWPRCFRLAVTVIGDRALAQDAAQEACAIVFRTLRTLRSAEAFDAWLYRIVMRESARVRRHNPVDYAAFEDRGSIADEVTALDVSRALRSLSPKHRDVIVLFYFDDLTSDEIGRILGVPHSTVRTRLGRAREHLRGLLDDYSDTAAREVEHHAM